MGFIERMIWVVVNRLQRTRLLVLEKDLFPTFSQHSPRYEKAKIAIHADNNHPLHNGYPGTKHL